MSRVRRDRRPWRLPGGKVVLSLLALAAVVGLGFLGRSYLAPAPEVVRPQHPEALDPAVAALIEPMIAAVEARPRDAALHAELGLAYEANLLWPEARSSFAHAVHLDGSQMPWRLHLAVATRQAGDAGEALAMLQTLARKDASSSALQQRLGEALLEAGDLAGAEAAFRRLIELAPGAVQGYAGLGDVLLQRQEVPAAVEALEQAVRLQPAYRPARYLLGRAYQRAGRNEEAGQALALGEGAAVDYLPDPLTGNVVRYTVNAAGRLELAGAYLDAGNPQQAARLLEETRAFHPANVMLLNTLAVAYLRTGRLDDAERLLQQARTLDEHAFYTYENLYSWALQSRRLDLALAYADSAVARAPERDDAHLTRAQALMEFGRFEEALASAGKALQLDARKAQNHGLSGEICFRMGRYDAARTHFEHAVAIDPDLLPAWIGLARVNRELGRPGEARNALAQAQRLAPDHRLVVQLARQLQAVR